MKLSISLGRILVLGIPVNNLASERDIRRRIVDKAIMILFVHDLYTIKLKFHYVICLITSQLFARAKSCASSGAKYRAENCERICSFIVSVHRKKLLRPIKYGRIARVLYVLRF